MLKYLELILKKKLTFLTIIYLCKSGFICNKRTLLYFILPKDCPVELFCIKDCDFQFTMLKQFQLFHFNLVISRECMGSQVNYFRSIGSQNNNNNNAKFQDQHI